MSSTFAGDPTAADGRVHAAGHIPGAVHLDWRAELIDPSETGDALLLAGPEQVANALAQAGITDGTTVVTYDDTIGLFAARTWWSLRVYGFESVRILDGGYPAWVEEGRPDFECGRFLRPWVASRLGPNPGCA